MKITRKNNSIKSCDAVPEVAVVEELIEPTVSCSCEGFDLAHKCVLDAIDALCPIAKEDSCAAEAIANLSVVALMLKK